MWQVWRLQPSPKKNNTKTSGFQNRRSFAVVSKEKKTGGVTFLCSYKKVTKENAWGEALKRQSIDASSIIQHFYPDSEPPSPQSPHPAVSKPGQ